MGAIYSQEQLTAFMQVVSSGSFSKAARQLNRSQAAISQAVRNLEQALGCTLFDRSGKQVRLCAHGEKLYRLCKERQRVQHQVEQLASDAHQLVESEVSLWFDPVIDSRSLGKLLVDFHHRFAFTRIRWEHDWQQATLAIVDSESLKKQPPQPGTRRDKVWHHYCEVPMQAVCGLSPAAGSHYIEVPWGPKSPQPCHLTATTPDTALQLVLHNMGWCWLPGHQFEACLPGQDYRILEQREPVIKAYQVGICSQRGPAHNWLLEQLLAPTEQARTEQRGSSHVA